MYFNKRSEENTIKNSKKFMELKTRLQDWEEKFCQILKETGLELEDVQNFSADQNNMSPSEWQLWQEEKKHHEDILAHEISLLRNLRELEQTYSNNGAVKSHWLYIR